LAIFIDTGVFYALYDTRDANHDSAVALLAHALAGKWGRAFLSNYVTLETTLLLQSKMGPRLSREFIKFLRESGIAELVVDEGTHERAKELFGNELALSLADSTTVGLLEALKIERLGTFDQRSFRKYSEKVLGPAYWDTIDVQERKKLKSRVSLA
jgi:predicted nucleic acid-binding protein